MKYDTIYERYFSSGNIQNEIIQLYKTVLLNLLLKDINGTFSMQCITSIIQDIPGS